MKKFIALFLAALMLLSFAACSANQNNNGKNNESTNTNESKKDTPAKTDKTPAEIETAIAKALGDGYLATVDIPEDEIALSALGYLDLTKVRTYVAKQAVVSSVDPDTVVIVECEDGYADEAVAKLNESFAQTVSYIRQYPFGVAKVEGARLYKVGNIVMLIIAGASFEGEDKEAEAKLAVEEYKKVDAAVTEIFGSLPENLAELTVQIPNPVVDVSYAKDFDRLGISMEAPEGAKNVAYAIIGDKIAEINFEVDGKEYTLRAAISNEDISGLYGTEIEEKELEDGAVYSEISDGVGTFRKISWKVEEVNFVLMNTDGASADALTTLYELVK